MEITVEGIIVHSPKNIERILIKVTEKNFILIKQKLQFERNKIIKYLKALKQEGIIKSNYRPKNRKIQDHLNEVCEVNRRMIKTIEKIDTIYR